MSNFGILGGGQERAMAKFKARRGRVIDLRKWNAGSRASKEARAGHVSRPKISLHARRQRMRALIVFACVAAASVFVWGLSTLSYSPRFAINSVAVSGAKDVPAPLIRAFVETKLYDGTNPLLSRENIFLYPRAGIEKSVSEYFPRIGAADVSRAGLLAQAITVTVKEREAFALWCPGRPPLAGGPESCYLMDDSGFIFARASTSSPNTYLIFGGGLSESSSPIGQKFLPTRLSEILELDKALRQAGFAPEEIYAEDEQDFSVQFKEGFTLRALFGADAGELVRNLQLALSSEPLRGKVDKVEYIDLRFGNRVYYKNRQ